MAVYTLTVGGVTRRARRGSVRLVRRANVRPTLEVEVLSLDGSYVPAEQDAVALIEDGVTIYGGRVQHPTSGGPDDQPIGAISTRIDCIDNNALADDLYLTTTFAGGTLKDFLQWVIDGYLTTKGTTLDPSQATGPAVPSRAFTYRSNLRVSDGLTNACAIAVGWTWAISPSNVLSAHAPNTVAAPFNLAPGDHHAIGDVQFEVTSEQYANRIVVLGNQSLILYYKDDFTAMTDGVRVTFPLTLTPAGPFAPLPNAGVVWIVADAGYEVAETFGLGSATWIYDPATNTITDMGDAGPVTVTAYRQFPLPLGRPMWIIYDGTPDAIGMAESIPDQAPPRGVVERILSSDLQDTVALTAIAAAELIQALARPTTVTYETDALGLVPGQYQTINVPARHLNGTFVVQQVETRDLVAMNADRTPRLRHTVTAVAYVAGATVYPGTVGDLFTQWSTDRGAAAGAAPAVSTGTGLTLPGDPREVIFNDGGQFGAAADLLYDKNGTGQTYGAVARPARVAVLLDGATSGTTAGPSLVASTATSATGGATQTSAAIDTTGATLLVVTASWDALASAAVTISDAKANTWIALTPSIQNCRTQLWYVVNPVVGLGHTVTLTGSAPMGPAFHTYAFAGAGVLDSTQTNLTGGTVGPVTPTPGALVLTTYGAYSPATDTVAPAAFLPTLHQIPGVAGVVCDQSAAWLVAATAAPITAVWTFSGGSHPVNSQGSILAVFTATTGTSSHLALANRTAGLADAMTVLVADDSTVEIQAADDVRLTAPTGLYVNGEGVITGLTGDVTAAGPGTVPATIANDAVTYAKLQNITAASRLLGRGSAAGAGNAEEITLGAGLTLTGTTLTASGGGGGASSYDCPLSDGDLSAADLIFADGDCIIVQVPV